MLMMMLITMSNNTTDIQTMQTLLCIIKCYLLMFLAQSAADEVDENVCQVYFAVFNEADEKDKKAWIGCDGDCGQWYHYRCAGFKRKSTMKVHKVRVPKVHVLKL